MPRMSAMHARDCAYVTSDGPAPCTCDHYGTFTVERTMPSGAVLNTLNLTEAHARTIARAVFMDARQRVDRIRVIRDLDDECIWDSKTSGGTTP